MVRTDARAIARGLRVCVLADGHLTSVIFPARTGMPDVVPVIPGIENRHQSVVSAWSRPAPGRSRGLVRGAGCGLVMTGGAGAGMVVINVVLCGPVMSRPV
jgi:hypothetical protein